MPEKLISELIELPEKVRKGDFVLKLSEGVTHPEKTLDQYVVTPQLVACFEDALSFIHDAVKEMSSKACYLHGSFGSGKSHFMAVLHLLLQHIPAVRNIPELAKVCGHHEWVEQKKFLLVPYYMIGARNMETAILGGYVDHVMQAHPGAPLPGVYLADEIFNNAKQHREALGDEKFFAAQVRQEIMEILLTREADRAMFKMVYPFSPALIQALVAVSSALQRERTALKLMLQMLVNRRDTLRLGDVIPLGDLWDVVAHGDEAFTDVMRVNFTNAKNLGSELLHTLAFLLGILDKCSEPIGQSLPAQG